MEATEQLVLVVAKNNEASVQLKMDCQETIINFKQVLKEAAMKMTEEKTSTNGGQREGGRENGEETRQSYADRVKIGIPTPHITAVAKVETQKRKI